MNGNYLLNEYPLLVMPSLAKKLGLNKAIALQQVHYWLQKSSHTINGSTWFYKTIEEWEDDFIFWSKSTIRRTLSELEKDKLLVTGNFNKKKYDKTKWYTINYPLLYQVMSVSSPCVQNEQSLFQNEHMDMVNLSTPIPETTTDIVVNDDDEKNARNEQLSSILTREQSIQEIEQCYMQRRGKGLFASPTDIAEIALVVDQGVKIKDAINWTNEVFDNYKPKHARDRINSFSYVSQYVLAKHHEKIERAKALSEGGGYGGENRRSNSGSNSEASESKTEDGTTGTSKGKRLIGTDGKIQDTECDF